MRRIIVLFFIIVTVGVAVDLPPLNAVSGTPSLSRITNFSVTIGAGLSDTITLTSFVPSGKYSGMMIEVNQDSISGLVLIDPVSPNGYSGEANMSTYITALTLVDNFKATFSDTLSLVAGAYNYYTYIILDNNKATSQTVTVNLYKIIWN